LQPVVGNFKKKAAKSPPGRKKSIKRDC